MGLSYQSGYFRQLFIGDGEPFDIVGKGVVNIKASGCNWKLKEVRRVFNLSTWCLWAKFVMLVLMFISPRVVGR